MIQKVIELINTELSDLNTFAVINGLCEYVSQSVQTEGGTVDVKYPALYINSDKLSQVTNFDFRSGFAFHIRNGDTSIDLEDSPRANKEFLKYTTPLKLVVIAKRSVTGTDNNYSHEQLANNVIHAIKNVGLQSLKTELNLSKIDVLVQLYNPNPDQLDEIFQNVEVKFRHDLTLVVVEYNIELYGYRECFQNYTC